MRLVTSVQRVVQAKVRAPSIPPRIRTTTSINQVSLRNPLQAPEDDLVPYKPLRTILKVRAINQFPNFVDLQSEPSPDTVFFYSETKTPALSSSPYNMDSPITTVPLLQSVCEPRALLSLHHSMPRNSEPPAFET